MDWEKLVGKKVINEQGKITKVTSYAALPSVDLEIGIGFVIGSPVSLQWREYKETLNEKIYCSGCNEIYGNCRCGQTDFVCKSIDVRESVKKLKEKLYAPGDHNQNELIDKICDKVFGM